MEWKVYLVVFAPDSSDLKIFPCDANVLVFDASCLICVVGGGEVFAKVETFLGLDVVVIGGLL